MGFARNPACREPIEEKDAPQAGKWPAENAAIIPAVRIAFVRLATYLLLALLPFQTMASVLERSCADSMPHCAAMAIESGGCCDHAASTFAHRQHGDMPGSGLHHHASCGMATTSCAVAAPMLALPGSVAVLPRPANALPRTSLTVSYRSFVPEALQRPPSILA